VQKPGPTAGGKFAPGTTAKLNPGTPPKKDPGPPVPPQRPRLPSKTDEIDQTTGSPVERKGVTPRAPSVVSAREVTAPSLDIKEIVLAAVKEATAPLEARIAKLEGRLAVLESDANDRNEAEATRPNVPLPPQVKVPPPVITGGSPFSTVPGIPVSASAFAPVPVAAAASAASAAAPTPELPSPGDPRPVMVSRPPPAINFEDAHLSPDEVAMFDGNKRGRRMTIYFVLVLMLLGGLMGLWAYISHG